MDELTCDECGTINDADRDVCELCGDPLGEEREEAERKSLLVLVPFAVLATVLSYGGGALLVLLAWGTQREVASILEQGTGRFFAVYSVIWLFAVAVAPMFTPKSNYDFGGGVHMGGYVGDPLSFRDDIHRGHAMTGCALFPLMIVNGLWRAVFARLFGTDDERGPD